MQLRQNGDSRRVLEEIADLLVPALAHGHQLTIQPHATDYACDIDIGTSAFSAEEALALEEIRAFESSPYSAKHRGPCEICRCAAPLPIEPVMTVAAIALNHGHLVQLQPAAEGHEVTVTISSERHGDFDRPLGPSRINMSAVELAMRTAR